MKVCPFRLVGVDELPAALTARTSLELADDVVEAFGCIGPRCMLFRIGEEDLRGGKLEEGWCSLGRPDH
jgi:hypothetical protein